MVGECAIKGRGGFEFACCRRHRLVQSEVQLLPVASRYWDKEGKFTAKGNYLAGRGRGWLRVKSSVRSLYASDSILLLAETGSQRHPSILFHSPWTRTPLSHVHVGNGMAIGTIVIGQNLVSCVTAASDAKTIGFGPAQRSPLKDYI